MGVNRAPRREHYPSEEEYRKARDEFLAPRFADRFYPVLALLTAVAMAAVVLKLSC